MEKLNGRTILIGRDPTQGRLLVALQGNGKSVTVGTPASVPNSVSRCKPAENAAHCKIEVGQSGTMVLTNLKPANVTYVNGMQVESKKIDNSSIIALGSDKYPIDLNLVLTAAGKLVENSTPPSAKTFSIKHLEKVWDNYESTIEEIQRKQQSRGNRRLLPIMLGSVSTIVSGVFAALGNQFRGTGLYFTIPIAVISFLIYFISFSQKDTSIEDRKKATEKFQDSYICPNPDCGKFLGNMGYKLLKRQYSMQCPYCKCKYEEN